MSQQSSDRPVQVLDQHGWALLRRIEDETGEKFLGELVENFCRDAVPAIAELHDLAVRRDGAAIAAVAHKLRGGSASIAGVAMAKACQVLEGRAREGDYEGAQVAAVEVRQEFEQLRAALEAEVGC